MSTNTRSAPGREADVATSGLSVWRERLLAIGMRQIHFAHKDLTVQFLEFKTRVLFFNLSGTTQLCRTPSVSQCLLKCGDSSLSPRVPHEGCQQSWWLHAGSVPMQQRVSQVGPCCALHKCHCSLLVGVTATSIPSADELTGFFRLFFVRTRLFLTSSASKVGFC